MDGTKRPNGNAPWNPGITGMWVCESLRRVVSTTCRTATHSKPSPSRLQDSTDMGWGTFTSLKRRRTAKEAARRDLALSAHLRTLWKSLYVVNGGYDGLRGGKHYGPGVPTLSRNGRAFLANPDLPRRLKLGAALNEPDPTTFYGGDPPDTRAIPRSPEEA
jgi:2,4-dienoyl-CoA reductase-like NADH-dependent reductase (Old Yellow Enzyme family)